MNKKLTERTIINILGADFTELKSCIGRENDYFDMERDSENRIIYLRVVNDDNYTGESYEFTYYNYMDVIDLFNKNKIKINQENGFGILSTPF